MPDIHVPAMDEPEELEPAAPGARHQQGKSLAKIAMEVALIGVGVFLGLMGEQWREHAGHRELAEASLRRFRSEFVTNRKAVADVKDRHVTSLQDIQAYFKADPKERALLASPFKGTHPAFLEYTAWDVALATQSLAYIDAGLATSIAHVYAVQRQLDNATRTATEAMYMKSGEENRAGLLGSMGIYFGDCVIIERRLLATYDEILARLDSALGESTARTTPGQ